MKKTVLILLQILLFTFSCLNALEIRKLEPLKENEILRLDYNKLHLNIEKISEKGSETYFSCKSDWAAWQISSDKRKVLIYENGMHDIYLLDGNDGTIQYKGHFNNSAFPSADFRYLITAELVPEDSMRNFFIYDLVNMKELYNFPWLSQREHFLNEGIFSFIFCRALEPDFDFLIYSVGEAGEAFAYSLLNAETKAFTEVLFEKSEKLPKHSAYQNGLE